MKKTIIILHHKNDAVRAYGFKVLIEPDEDKWHAYCPSLSGGYTWGHSKEEALKNLQEVIGVIVEELVEEGKPIPVGEVELSKEGERMLKESVEDVEKASVKRLDKVDDSTP